MNTRTSVWIGMFIGSSVGSYVPVLWGSGLFSMWSIFFSGVGAVLGILLAYKLSS